jgi:hypothetical protein
MAAKIPKEGGSSGSTLPADLQELLKKLALKDEELDDVVLQSDDFVNLKEGAQWMAVVRLHTTKHVGNQPFFRRWTYRGALPRSGQSGRQRIICLCSRFPTWGIGIE